ncbi:MAG: transporter substrate-binding domain-containing protein [Treponema sp.]|nr:transporter substrate-binding domain-containing protein [Treponema sp.]
MKKYLFLFLSAVCFFLSACYNPKPKDMLDQVKTKGELVIALEGAWEPWNYHNEQNQLVGFDVDVAKELCRRIGVKARFIELEWERLLNCLEKHECDIVMNGVAITPERKERFYFSTPYAYERAVVIIRKDNDEIKSFGDLNGRTSANSLGSTYDALARKHGAIPIIVDTFDETINLLLQNRVESTVNSVLAFNTYMKNNSSAPLKAVAVSEEFSRVAIPCRKTSENLTLLMEMNNALEAMRFDGTLKDISMKYFGQDVSK